MTSRRTARRRRRRQALWFPVKLTPPTLQITDAEAAELRIDIRAVEAAMARRRRPA